MTILFISTNVLVLLALTSLAPKNKISYSDHITIILIFKVICFYSVDSRIIRLANPIIFECLYILTLLSLELSKLFFVFLHKLLRLLF